MAESLLTFVLRANLKMDTHQARKNFPLKQLTTQIDAIKALNKPIVVVCMSGIRSGQAKTILEKEGIEVENGGSWYAFK
jgi:phage shock protein E